MKQIFVLRDTKAKYYHVPEVFRNTGEAIRAISNSVNSDQANTFRRNAEDYSLFKVAEYDELEGKIIPLESKEHVVDLIDLVEEK